MGFLIDTNAICDYYTATLPDKAWARLAVILEAGPLVSVITEIEVLSWKTPKPDIERKARQLVAKSEVIDLTPDIVDKTIELRRAKRLKTPDAIIAATAVVHGLTLVTSDADFRGISGLKTIDLFGLG